MKTLRDSFEENYEAVVQPCNNKQGFRIRYEYIGSWRVFCVPASRLSLAKSTCALQCIMSIAVFMLGALADSPLNANRYVSLPGMLSVAAMVVEVFGVFQFCASKERMTKLDFEDIRFKLFLAPPMHALLLAWAAIAALLQLPRLNGTMMDILVPVCFGFSSVLAMLIFLCYRSLPYRIEKNNRTCSRAARPEGDLGAQPK